jgi:hypothetical protein
MANRLPSAEVSELLNALSESAVAGASGTCFRDVEDLRLQRGWEQGRVPLLAPASCALRKEQRFEALGFEHCIDSGGLRNPVDVPRIGIERIRPFEEVLGGPGHQIQIKRIQVERQPASEFVAPGVSVEPGSEVWLWESVLIRDGEPIAHLQENISAQPVSFAGGANAPLEINDDGGTTLLTALNKAAGRGLGPGECQIGLSQVGPSRAKLLDLRASDPVLVLTQYVRHANRPFYLAKCLIADRAGHLSVMQSLQS